MLELTRRTDLFFCFSTIIILKTSKLIANFVEIGRFYLFSFYSNYYLYLHLTDIKIKATKHWFPSINDKFVIKQPIYYCHYFF